ncbi:hypothetical protein [Actinomycetospora sp.]|jgi:hypothetical protein|uniref:hypothetical protein n=1 Tax=Actinomycetospora sp. TaxID=1872135 RepID=UPI002F41FBDE
MAQQETEAKQEPAAPDGTAQKGTEQEPAGQEAAGRHAASDAPPAEQATGKSAQAPSEAPTETSAQAPSEAPTQKAAPADAPTERSTTPGQPRGGADTSWAEPEHTGTTRHRSVDVGELAWRTGNVLATVIRTLALLFALVLIVNVVLVLVGVNPANGVAQFVSGAANLVILGFRDLFVPANPILMIIVNSLIAAAFWVFVGELVSRVIRFLAARVK